jgi:hypothetical protein
MKSPLIPFIGLGERGKLEIKMSAFPLYPLSPMHLRGKPVPAIVQNFLDTGEGSPVEILQSMTDYYKNKKTK